MEYKDIPGFSNYQISKDESVWSKHYNKILKPKIDRYGYYVINMINDEGIRKFPTIHRLVAITYIPNPDNKPQVNHKDGNKLNNNISNLEWVTCKENILHSYSADLNKNHYFITVKDLWLNTEYHWSSFKSAARYLGFVAATLIYLSKHSKDRPIIDRFIVKILDEDRFTSNGLNFGREIYIIEIFQL